MQAIRVFAYGKQTAENIGVFYALLQLRQKSTSREKGR